MATADFIFCGGIPAVPYLSVYAATKAFDLLFAEGLAEETASYGINVCALCPGRPIGVR